MWRRRGHVDVCRRVRSMSMWRRRRVGRRVSLLLLASCRLVRGWVEPSRLLMRWRRRRRGDMRWDLMGRVVMLDMRRGRGERGRVVSRLMVGRRWRQSSRLVGVPSHERRRELMLAIALEGPVSLTRSTLVLRTMRGRRREMRSRRVRRTGPVGRVVRACPTAERARRSRSFVLGHHLGDGDRSRVHRRLPL